MTHTFTYDGHKSTEFGLVISGAATYGAPCRDIQQIQVPGRSGDVIIDNGRYANTSITYRCAIMRNASVNLPAARDFFMSRSGGYYRLTDDYRPDEYRMVRVSDVFSPTVFNASYAVFDLTFDADPRRFLISGETPITVAAGATITLTNPTWDAALPIITVTAPGTVTIGTVSLTAAEAMTIDCDTQDAYSGNENKNSSLTIPGLEFPVLASGDTAVTNSTSDSITITPRWWRL